MIHIWNSGFICKKSGIWDPRLPTPAVDKVIRKIIGEPTCGNHLDYYQTFYEFFDELRGEVQKTIGDSSINWRTRVVNPEADQGQKGDLLGNPHKEPLFFETNSPGILRVPNYPCSRIGARLSQIFRCSFTVLTVPWSILHLSAKLAEWGFYDIEFWSGYCAKFHRPKLFESKCLEPFSRLLQHLYFSDFARKTVTPRTKWFLTGLF